MKHTIQDLFRPVGPSVCQTQSVDAAIRTLDRTKSEHVIVRDLSHRPVGVITTEDIENLAHMRPSAWPRKSCAQVVQRMPDVLRAEDPIENLVHYYLEHGVAPLVVSHEGEPVGVLHPTEVFQWCAQHDSTLLEELAGRARSAQLDRSALASA